MFSSKTETLYSKLTNYSFEFPERDVEAISPERDTRGKFVSCHNGQKFKAKKLQSLSEHEIRPDSIIGIDEIQFFGEEESVKFVEKCLSMNVILIASGLNSTFEQKPWPTCVAILPFAQVISKLASCDYCHSEANYTKRLIDDNEKILIGGPDKYSAVCWKHLKFKKEDLPEKIKRQRKDFSFYE